MLQAAATPSRRFTSRVPVAADVTGDVWVFWHCHGRDDLSRIRDIGLGGVFLETSAAKAVGTATNLHFLVREGQIRAEAIVRHIQPGRGLGLRFTAVTDQDRPHLNALVRRLRGAAQSK